MSPGVQDAPELLTGEQVADRLGISRERVRQLTGRPDFPQPVGRVGRAVVWSEDDVSAYANGVRRFFAINGYPINPERARELAVRLGRDRNPKRRTAASETAALIQEQLDAGGAAINVTGDHAIAVFAAIDKWLEDTNVDVVGKKLMDLRYRLFADLQDAGVFE